MSRGILITFGAVLVFGAALFLYLTSDDASHSLVFSTWGTSAEVESFQRLIQRYNESRHPRHAVKLSHGEQYQYTERLLVQAAARAFPDVIHLDGKDLPLFVQKGLLDDLTPSIDRDTSIDTGAFLPELLPGCRVGARYYALPHNFSTLVLYYNRDHFDAEGIPYPDGTWTWQNLLEASQKLTKKDPAGKIVRYGCLMQIAFSTLIYQNGGSVLNETLDSCVIASPGAAGAIQFAVDLSEKYHVTWSMLSQNLQWDDMVAGGRLSMIANGRWAASYYTKSGTIDVAPLPRGKFRKGGVTSHVMTISSQSAKKEEAWEFLKFLVSEEGQRMVNQDGVNIPALRSVVYSDEFLRHRTTPTMNNQVFLDELRSSVGWPFVQGPWVSSYVLQSQLELAVRRVLLGQATTMQSLKIMDDEVNRNIQTQRRVAEPKRFAGSVMFYLCLTIVATGSLIVWNIRGRRRSHDD